MIPNHKQFIEAIEGQKKVSLRLYSRADSGIVDLVCAPLDYGPGTEVQNGVNHYWFWDYTRNTGSPVLVLLPEQVISLSVLGATFDPAGITAPLPAWSVPRNWKVPAGAGTGIPSAELGKTGTPLIVSPAPHLVSS